MAYSWNDSYSVEIKSIDNQHKKLFELINSFYENISKGSPKEKLAEVILGLKDYTVLHFSNEERYMKMYNFPGFDAHKKEHEAFILKVKDLEDRYLSGKLVLSVEVTNFMKDWIIKHILGTDKLYIDHFKKNGVL